jgi:hypothetical protein
MIRCIIDTKLARCGYLARLPGLFRLCEDLRIRHGHAINIAARVQEAEQAHTVRCVISAHVVSTFDQGTERVLPLGEEVVKGISLPIPIFEYQPKEGDPIASSPEPAIAVRGESWARIGDEHITTLRKMLAGCAAHSSSAFLLRLSDDRILEA